MTFLEFAAPPLTKLIQTLATKSLTQALQGVRRERQMKRLIEDAVDRVVEQAEGYLRSEKLARESRSCCSPPFSPSSSRSWTSRRACFAPASMGSVSSNRRTPPGSCRRKF